MPQFVRRGIVTAGLTLAGAIFIYFTAIRSSDPLLKLLVIFGGMAAVFIFIKVYLFRS